MDVASGRPRFYSLVYGLPGGQHRWGVFLWFLSLDKQRKELVRNKHGLCSAQPQNGRNNATALDRLVGVSPVLTAILRCKSLWQRASDFSCSCKKSNQKNTPLGVALRASRERSAYGKAVPTRHPCRDGTKQAIHGLFTSPTALRSRRPHTGEGNQNPCRALHGAFTRLPQASPQRHQKGTGNPKPKPKPNPRLRRKSPLIVMQIKQPPSR
jgi:hypothetical protein